jgi:hypothetical protein
MQPKNPSRRNLLGGILVGLLAWAGFPRPARAVQPLPPAPLPAVEAYCCEGPLEWVTTSVYKAGELISKTRALGRMSATTTLTYDGPSGITTITEFSPE